VTTTDQTGRRSEQHYDNRGNLFSTVTNVAGRSSTVLYDYDSLGRLRSQTEPHDVTQGEPGARESFEYDNLGQLRKVTHHDGSTVVIDRSDPLTVDITEVPATPEPGNLPKHTVITKTEDELVSSVRELGQTGSALIRGVDYVYEEGQRLKNVTQLNGPQTTYSYLGEPNPVTVNDAEHGQTIITYDGFNQARHVLHDPAYPSTIDREFDSLGRLTRLTTVDPNVDSPGVTTSTQTRYIYDSGLGGIGQRSYAISPDGVTTSYSYTAEGLASEVRYDSAFGSYSIDFTYDGLGRPKHIDYPAANNKLPRFGVDLSYNDSTSGSDPQFIDGTLKAVTRGNDTFWSTISREIGGIADQAQLAGGLTQSTAIDPATRRLQGISVADSQNVYDVQYEYFSGGNIKTHTDNLTGTVDHYTYDEFDALSTWTSSGAGEIYSYDGLGNQVSNGDAISSFTGGASPYQVMSRTVSGETRTFTYDPLGRQTQMAVNGTTARKVTYTPFDLPKQVQIFPPLPGFPNHSYSYDADQQKVHEDDGTFETTYAGPFYERRTNKATCKIDDVFYVFAEGQRVAQVVQSHDGTFCIDSNTGKGTSHPIVKAAVETITALHSDLQGTVTAATTAGSSPVTNRQAFSPFGGRLPTSAGNQSMPINKVTLGLADQEYDDTVGLVNMRGRVYDSITRTFLTPDPLVAEPLKSGGWNKYAYVLNNPLKYVDPSGFDPVEITTGSGTSTTVDIDMTIVEHGTDPTLFNSVIIQSEEPLDQSVAPSTPESFDPGTSSDAGNSPAALPALASVGDPVRPPPREYRNSSTGKYLEDKPPDFKPDGPVALLEWAVCGVFGCGPANAPEETDKNTYASPNQTDKSAATAAMLTAALTPEKDAVELGYSVAAEVKLPVAAWGRSAAVHERLANSILHDQLLADPELRTVLEELIPGVTEDVSSVGGATTPSGWIWHHAQDSGVMQLVPAEQHTPGSSFWGALHPGGYGGYASWARAFGAPPR